MRLPFDELHSLAQENEIAILPIRFEHTQILSKLPFHHKDPFDRMLISQSLVEDLPILTVDSSFAGYLCKVIW